MNPLVSLNEAKALVTFLPSKRNEGGVNLWSCPVYGLLKKGTNSLILQVLSCCVVYLVYLVYVYCLRRKNFSTFYKLNTFCIFHEIIANARALQLCDVILFTSDYIFCRFGLLTRVMPKNTKRTCTYLPACVCVPFQ